MASKCGCAGNSCSCKVIAGENAKVRGTGAQNNPIIIDALPMSLSVQDTTTVDLTLTGSGSVSNPWELTAVVAGGTFGGKWERWSGTQAQYNAIVTKDPDTLYGITGP